MPPHFRVEELRHFPCYPAQVEAHTVFHRRHIQFFGHGVYMHYWDEIVKCFFKKEFLALVSRAKTPEKSRLRVKLAALLRESAGFFCIPFFNAFPSARPGSAASLPHVFRYLHGTEMRAAHGTEMRGLRAFLRQSFVMEFARGFGDRSRD